MLLRKEQLVRLIAHREQLAAAAAQRQARMLQRLAFTLMEIIVVVAIILILASAAVVVVPKFLDDANLGRAKMDVKTIEKAVMAYKVKYNDYPQSLVELTQRGQRDNSLAFLERTAIVDPWGNEYIYQPSTLNPNTGVPLIMSNGPSTNPTPIRNWADNF